MAIRDLLEIHWKKEWEHYFKLMDLVALIQKGWPDTLRLYQGFNLDSIAAEIYCFVAGDSGACTCTVCSHERQTFNRRGSMLCQAWSRDSLLSCAITTFSFLLFLGSKMAVLSCKPHVAIFEFM